MNASAGHALLKRPGLHHASAPYCIIQERQAVRFTPISTAALVNSALPGTNGATCAVAACQRPALSSSAARAAREAAAPDAERSQHSLVILSAEVDGSVSAQALPRASFFADAVTLEFDGPAYLDARERYQARFPDAVQTFALGDFSMFALRLQSARLVAGFGRAYGLTSESLKAVLRGTSAP